MSIIDEFIVSNIPLVSVIIAAYNAEKYIAETIKSVLKQTYKNLEIIVIDDGSKDKTCNIIKKFDDSRIKLYKIKNSGQSYARNYGIDISNGELLAPFDADDIMLDDKIESQVSFFNNNNNIPIVVSDYINFGSDDVYLKPHFKRCTVLQKIFKKNNTNELILSPSESCNILPLENFTITGSTMYFKKLAEKLSGYNTSLHVGEDFEFFYRAAMNYKIGVVNKICFKRRIHKNNIMRENSISIINSKVESRKRILEYEKNKNIRKKFFRAISQDYYSIVKDTFNDSKKISLEYLAKSLNYKFITPILSKH